MTLQEELFTEIGIALTGSEAGKLFGKKCYKVNTKAFACFFEEEMVFKLTAKVHDEALNLEGAHLFDPSGKGRPMKEWVQVPYLHKDKWKSFAEEAINYVSKL